MAAEVAHKGLATICPPHVRIHVGLAASTAHWAQLTKVHNLSSKVVGSEVNKTKDELDDTDG